uniref:C->U-editing enzyme APOBEC-1 n=1 Tax=Podarcis muralis TaxID=64176 RepID=A0A670KC45_PODMU
RATGAHPATGDSNRRPYNRQVRGRPERTHLLYEIRWGRSRRYWRNWCTSNRTHHAEINFLENACEEIDRRTTTPCTVTWFLTWSPCGKCSGRIKQFLQEHPNVTLKICAAQLYKQNYRFNQKGLRDLANFGVRIYIMQLSAWLLLGEEGEWEGSPPLSPAVTSGEGDKVEIQLNEELPSCEMVEEVEGGREGAASRDLPGESEGTSFSKEKNRECRGV